MRYNLIYDVIGVDVFLRKKGFQPVPLILLLWLQVRISIAFYLVTVLLFYWLYGITYISKIQIVVYYQSYVLIGWATTRLYVIAHV